MQIHVIKIPTPAEDPKMFSDVVLSDLGRKMYEDMRGAGERTLALVPEPQRIKVLVECLTHLTILGSMTLAEMHGTDEETARLALYRFVIKNLVKGGRHAKARSR